MLLKDLPFHKFNPERLNITHTYWRFYQYLFFFFVKQNLPHYQDINIQS